MNDRPIRLDSFKNAHNHYHLRKRTTTDAGEAPHHHDCYQLVYVTKGRMYHGLPERLVTLKPGDAFLVPPGYVHGTQASPGFENEFYSLSFRQALFSPGFVASPPYKFLSALRMNSMEQRPGDVRLRVHLAEADQGNMERLFRCLTCEFSANWDQEDTMAESLVAAMLRILARTYFGGRRQDSMEQARDVVRACMRYVDSNYMLDLTVDGLARQFAMSRSSFADLFAREAGVPVKQYVHRTRIRQAQNLCAVPTLSVREIAQLVGYGDFSTFYRNFKKITGLSPMEYRAEREKEDRTR